MPWQTLMPMPNPSLVTNMEFQHTPVLLQECLNGLHIQSAGIYVDATIGGGGHSYHILRQLSNSGHLYGFDQDEMAIETAKTRLSTLSQPNFTLVHKNYRYLKGELLAHGVSSVNGFLFDLGVSSYQFDQGERGFSYNQDAHLDMRMDTRNALTAALVVNSYSEAKLTHLLFNYGEEKFSRSIVRKIIAYRQVKPIETTFELVDIIKSAIPSAARQDGGHPAKRTFQAIRIEVNQELEVLKEALHDAASMLSKGGRLCVISFHSLEDRIVKEYFKSLSEPPVWNRNMPIPPVAFQSNFKVVAKKPIVSSPEELEQNRRAHSAKLRIIERTGGNER